MPKVYTFVTNAYEDISRGIMHEITPTYHHPVVAESAISASALSNLTHQTNGSTGMYHYARARHSQ